MNKSQSIEEENRQLHEQLRESGRLLSAFTNHLKYLIVRFDRQLNIVYVNDSMAAFTGIPSEHLSGKPIDEAGLSSGLTNFLKTNLTEVFANGMAKEVITGLFSAGDESQFITTFLPETGSNPKYFDHILVTLHRVSTEEIEYIKQLQKPSEVEDIFRTIFDLTDEGFCIIEMKIEPNKPLDYRFIEINKAFEQQSKLKNAKGKWMRDLQPRHEEYWFETYRDVVLEQKPVHFEQQARMLDNTWFSVHAFPVGLPEYHHVAVIINDITERKKMEATIESLSKFPDENPNPVFRIDTHGKLMFNNEAGNTLMKTWKCRVGDQIPGSWRSKFIETLTENRLKEFRIELGDRIYSLLAVPVAQQNYINVYGSDVTQIYTLQDEIWENSERFRSIFENTTIGIIEATHGDRILNVNEKLCLLLGYTPEEIIGKTVADITHTDDRKITETMIAQLGDNVDLSDYEKRYLRKDNTPVWVHVIVSAVRNNKGKHVKSIATVEDISQRKMAEEALRESEEMFRKLFELHGSIMMLIEPETGEIIDANSAAAKFYNYSRKQLRSMNISQLNQMSPDELKEKRKLVLKNKKEQFQFIHRLATGELRWVEVYSSKITVRNSELLFSVIHDITEQKNVERELMESETRFRNTFENAAVGMAHISPEGTWLKTNDTLCRITGYSPDELKRLSVMDIAHPEDLSLNKQLIDQLTYGSLHQDTKELRFIRKTGESIWVLITLASQFNADGKVAHLISVIEDITERKKIEAEIEKINNELKIANNFLESVMHIAMHDLRSPVANLISCFQLMEETENGLQENKYLLYYKLALNKLSTTLDGLTELLQFLQIKQVPAQYVNPDEIFRSVITENNLQIGGGKINYSINKIKEIVYVKPFFESIIKNLVGNAIKYQK